MLSPPVNNRGAWFMKSTALCLAAFALALPALSQDLPDQVRSGYLASGAFDVMKVLPPAPHPGDARAEADRAIFRATRHWIGTPRGAMARDDVAATPADMARHYSCALGVTLTPQTAPKTLYFISKAGVDTNTQGTGAKNVFKRRRPLLIDKGAVCQPRADLIDSYDYPSGHATWGWTWAVLLAEMAPERATPILARGRAYGESRIVCGAHNASAVEAGRLTAVSVIAAQHGDARFQADLAAAKAELATLRSDPAAAHPSMCEAETKLVAAPIL